MDHRGPQRPLVNEWPKAVRDTVKAGRIEIDGMGKSKLRIAAPPIVTPTGAFRGGLKIFDLEELL